MRSQFLKGALVGGLSGALVMVATAALAGSGIGGVFNLGVKNSVNATSALIGKTAGAMLRVKNTGSGPAALFQVAAGKAPFAVNSSVTVANLSAAHATNADHAANADRATNADNLGGVPAASYQLACQEGTVLGFAPVPASGSFSSIYTPLSGKFNCSGIGHPVSAKRVAQGDYRVAFCDIGPALGPQALGIDQSFNDFVSISPVVPPDPDVGAVACGNMGGNSEFKVTTRDAGGVGQDEPFLIAEI